MPVRARFVPGYDPRLGTLDEQPHGWAGIAHSRVSELYDPSSQFSDYGLITLDRDVGGSNSTGYFHMRATRNDSSQDWLQARRRGCQAPAAAPAATSRQGRSACTCLQLRTAETCGRLSLCAAWAVALTERACLLGTHAAWGSPPAHRSHACGRAGADRADGRLPGRQARHDVDAELHRHRPRGL